MSDEAESLHDRIMREHGERYAAMTPREQSTFNEQRKAVEDKRLLAEISVQNKKLSDVTLGEFMDELESRLQPFLAKLDETK